MVNLAKRAKRKRLAQEARRREASRPAHQMVPANLSDPGTEREEEDDQEIKFAFRRQNVEEPLPTPARAQATTGNLCHDNYLIQHYIQPPHQW